MNEPATRHEPQAGEGDPERRRPTRCVRCGGSGVLPRPRLPGEPESVVLCPTCGGTGLLEPEPNSADGTFFREIRWLQQTKGWSQMSCMRWGIALLPFLAIGAASAAATAQESADHQACYEGAQHDACFREGKRHYGSESYDEAYKAYLRGFELKPNFQAAGNLGNVELKLGLYEAAFAHLKYSQDNLPPTDRGTEIENRLQEKIDEALQHVGGRKFVVDPATATTEIDGVVLNLGVSPWIGLKPGPHTVRITAAGYQPVDQTIQVRAGAEEVMRYTLSPISGVPAPPVTEPGDGSISSTRLAVGITGVGLGIVGLAAALILGVTAGDRDDSVEELQARAIADGGETNPCGAGSPILSTNTCSQLREFLDERETFKGAAIGAGIAGGLLVIGGILTLALPGDEDTEVGVHASFSTAGVSLGGRF